MDQESENVPPESDLPPGKKGFLKYARIVIASGVITLIILGILLIVQVVDSGSSSDSRSESQNVLANSDNRCVECHEKNTPGIVQQFGHSTKAAEGVTCQDCHEVKKDYPGAVAHQDTHVLPSPTPKICANCHQQQVEQFRQSRHSIPAYAAMWGTKKLSDRHKQLYDEIPEANKPINAARNVLFKKEGRAITKFACEKCHNIGKPRKDGSVGTCQKCHLRHKFDIKQARKPETCNACHIGPDHPQFEIYENSPHGISYHTQGENWNWDAKAGTQTVKDFPAPTCATCHMSGFGGASTTHDVGERLSWYLFPPISTKRPVWQENRRRMKNVCSNCHNRNFVDQFYKDADQLTLKINDWVRKGKGMIEDLREKGLLTKEKFDEPIEYEYFELWHHWGRTAKFGAWMLGPDYTQWHGAYEMLKSQTHLEEMRNDLLRDHGMEVPDERENGDSKSSGEDDNGANNKKQSGGDSQESSKDGNEPGPTDSDRGGTNSKSDEAE